MSFFIKICCFCLNERANLINLNTRTFQTVTMSNKLMFCVNTGFDTQNIPTFICLKCCAKLEEAYEFKKMCLGNFNRFRGYIRKLKTIDNPCKMENLFKDVNILVSDIRSCKINSGQEEGLKDESEKVLEKIVKCAQTDNKNQELSEKHLKSIHSQMLEEKPETNEETYKRNELEHLDPLFIKREIPDYSDLNVHKKIMICKSQKQHSPEELKLLLHKEEILDDENEENLQIESELDCTPSLELNKAVNAEESIETEVFYSCELCRKQFHAKPNLIRHILNHKRRKSHFCSICRKAFVSKNNLKQHLSGHKKTFTSYRQENKLEDTNSQCGTKNETEQEDTLKNNGQYPYSCSTCGRCFRKKTYLKTHMFIHTRPRQYHCSICGKEFNQKGNMVRHMNKHILNYDEQPHCCTICRKCFVGNFELQRHMLIHTELRPYSCSYCGKGFIQRSNMNRHMLVHREQSHLC